MGMYDTIHHSMKCPICKSNIEIEEQIKWADCLLGDYYIGDEINAADGIYDYATVVRPTLFSQCNNCLNIIYYEVVVWNGILCDIRPSKNWKEMSKREGK